MRLRRMLVVLAILLAGVSVMLSSQAQTGEPVLVVDSSGEACQRPELVAYPCFRSIQEALGGAGSSAAILVYAGEQPYPGFSLRSSSIRALLIQGQIRSGETQRPKVAGTISLEGEFQIILNDLDIQGTISVGTSSLGPVFTRLQNLTIESKETAVRVGQAGLVEILDSALCGGSCIQPGGASGCGIELAFSGRGVLVVQSQQGSTVIWGFQDGICTKGAQQSRALYLLDVEIAFNQQHGINLTGDPTRPANFFLGVQKSDIQFNGRDGVRLENLNGFVWSNTIGFNGRHGMVLGGSGEVDISYNEIKGNGDCGALKKLEPMTVTGSSNEISGNGRDLCGDFPPDFKK